MDRRNKIIIIEGLWGVGKTTYAAELAQQCEGIFILEPDHQKLIKKPSDIEVWYFKKFIMLEKKALNSAQKKLVILERSRLSVLAYLYALNDLERLHRFENELEVSNFHPDELILIHRSLQETLPLLTDPTHKKFKKIPVLANNYQFIVRYHEYLINNAYRLGSKKIRLIEIPQKRKDPIGEIESNI